ncbi:MAG: nucleoside-diphosphate kinase [Bacillota bacterium]|nr:nucleoside-diphosphate kinase [Bacillota bacterium]
MERTFVMVKPDGVQRGLVGEVVGRLERKGLKPVAMKLVRLDRSTAEAHYAVHRDKPFFRPLVEFVTAGPVVAMVWEGPSAVEVVRNLLGATDGRKAAPGTLRGDFGLDIQMNLVHGSDSPESAAAEIALHFRPEEIVEWSRSSELWLHEEG